MHPVSTGAVSPRKLEANRANALKSTGPKTDAGRARSSLNARRHNALASAATLLAEPDQERDALLARYTADLRPSSVVEESLVREIAVADWRIQHLDRVELGVTAYQMQASYNVANELDALRRFGAQPWACNRCGAEPPPEAYPEPEPDPPELSETGPAGRTALLGAAWFANAYLFSLLHRYQAQARRDYYRALKQLSLVRTGEAGVLPQAPPRTQPVEPGSAPQKGETKPAISDFRLKWDVHDYKYIFTPEEWRRIIAGHDNESVVLKKK
ncbi:MAG: hypothetical protein KIT09_25610 [Bryobacteraceae bacterium]|nr:hypothetical protein [Bryobacteraceae bacterium]